MSTGPGPQPLLSLLRPKTAENIPRTSRKILNYFRSAFAFHAQKPKEITAAKPNIEGKRGKWEGKWKIQGGAGRSICIFFC